MTKREDITEHRNKPRRMGYRVDGRLPFNVIDLSLINASED